MLKSNDRFARQNRCRHPPEFPLASSCSSIVHHLSGTSPPALPPPHRLYTDRTGRRCARDTKMPEISPRPTKIDLHFRCAMGASKTPFDSRVSWTPWSVFQDGSDENPARTRWTLWSRGETFPFDGADAAPVTASCSRHRFRKATGASSLPEGRTGPENPRSPVVDHVGGPCVPRGTRMLLGGTTPPRLYSTW